MQRAVTSQSALCPLLSLGAVAGVCFPGGGRHVPALPRPPSLPPGAASSPVQWSQGSWQERAWGEALWPCSGWHLQLASLLPE